MQPEDPDVPFFDTSLCGVNFFGWDNTCVRCVRRTSPRELPVVLVGLVLYLLV